MNEIVNEFLLAGDKFMSEIHLRQHGFTYNTCRSLKKTKKEHKSLKKEKIHESFIKTS